MKKILFCIPLLVSSLVFSCRGEDKAIPKDYSKYTVSCMGDSITYGYTPHTGVQLENPYPKLLEKTLGFKKVYNYGISGSTVANGVNSYEPMVDRIRNIDPNTNGIIMYGGGNDLARELPIGEPGNTDPTTLYGAFFNICTYLRFYFKDAFIMFITPLPAKLWGEYYYLTNVIKPMQYTCWLFNIPLLNLTYDSKFEEEIESGVNDGIHPTQNYVTNVLTPRIANFIKTHL